jgi:ERCC4-related helicase
MTDKNQKFYNHEFLKTDMIEWRDYQINIAKITKSQNTLVVLPTALGKTIIALITAMEVLKRAPESKIFFLAPTRPLVMQHFTTFQGFIIPSVKCCLFSSNLTPVKRAYALNENQIFFSTPQILQNDLKNGLYSIEGISLLIIDEAHKSRKKYAYTYVASAYLEQCQHPLILALTASPGKDADYINLLCETLQIEQIVFRNNDSKDVKDYTYDIDTILNIIQLPYEITVSQEILKTAIRKITNNFVQHEIFPKRNYYSKFDFIRLIQDLKKLDFLLDPHLTSAEKEKYLGLYQELNFPHLLDIFGSNKEIKQHTVFFQAINGIYLEHLHEILTTQDIRLFRTYLNKLKNRAKEGNKRIIRLLNSKHIKGIQEILKPIQKSPKIPKLYDILRNEFMEDPNAKIIIFTQYREMGTYLEKELNQTHSIKGTIIKAKRFVGQASREDDRGLNQKQQHEIIQQFSRCEYNILIATSVAEEGLDIPNVNAVVFYEAVPSEIRLIQRRGRTGRHSIGKCYCLVAADTLDQIYHNVSHRKENKMKKLISTPGAINTVDTLPRSKTMPKFKKKTLAEIKEKYDSKKELKLKEKMQHLEEIVQDHKPVVINDYTNYFAEQSKKRIKMMQENIKKSR